MTGSETISDNALPARPRLIVEFVAFYAAAPLVMAVLLPPLWMFTVLGGLTFVGIVLLAATPGFAWSDLIDGTRRIGWGLVGGVALATAAVGFLILQLTAPEAAFALPRRNLELMLMIAALYPVLSALPQELVFRPLFFRRYAALLPGDVRAQIVVNAAVFSFAHLMYWSAIVAAMTFAGGLVFAWSYRVRGNFPEAVVAHSIAGIVVFAVGLGTFFYSGNVTRPF